MVCKVVWTVDGIDGVGGKMETGRRAGDPELVVRAVRVKRGWGDCGHSKKGVVMRCWGFGDGEVGGENGRGRRGLWTSEERKLG